jgi:hypothetical protein
MKEFEKCKLARKMILTKAAEIICYKDSWSDKFKIEEINSLGDNFKKHNELIDLSKLTRDQAEELEFGNWSEDTEMLLIPLWIYPFLDNTVKLKVECIDGEVKDLYPNEMDNDHRFGFIAYGLNF